MDDLFRWLALATFVGALSVSAVRRWKAHQQSGGAISRRNESPVLIAGRLLVALPLFGSVVASTFSPEAMAWASLGAPTWVRWLGVAAGAAVVPTVHVVLSALGKNVSETILTKPQHQLITRGPYRWIRHPLYTTGIALFVSLGLTLDSWLILVLALVALLAIRVVVVPREEAHLLAAFGGEYERYRLQTGALFPRLRRVR